MHGMVSYSKFTELHLQSNIQLYPMSWPPAWVYQELCMDVLTQMKSAHAGKTILGTAIAMNDDVILYYLQDGIWVSFRI